MISKPHNVICQSSYPQLQRKPLAGSSIEPRAQPSPFSLPLLDHVFPVLPEELPRGPHPQASSCGSDAACHRVSNTPHSKAESRAEGSAMHRLALPAVHAGRRPYRLQGARMNAAAPIRSDPSRPAPFAAGAPRSHPGADRSRMQGRSSDHSGIHANQRIYSQPAVSLHAVSSLLLRALCGVAPMLVASFVWPPRGASQVSPPQCGSHTPRGGRA